MCHRRMPALRGKWFAPSDLAAMTEMRAQVGAEGVENAELTVFSPKHDEVGVKVF